MAKNTYRRGERVEVKHTERHNGVSVETWRTGAITSPSAPNYGNKSKYVRVRLDSQQPFETGFTYSEDYVRPDMTGRTEFERRHYDLRYLSHNDIAAITIALSAVNHRDDVLTDDVVQSLLRKLPELPKDKP